MYPRGKPSSDGQHHHKGHHEAPSTHRRHNKHEDFPVAQWLRVHLPMQGTQVQSLIQKDCAYCGAMLPRTTATEPVLQSSCSTTEATAMRSPCATTQGRPCSLQLEKRSNKSPEQTKITSKNVLKGRWKCKNTRSSSSPKTMNNFVSSDFRVASQSSHEVHLLISGHSFKCCTV